MATKILLLMCLYCSRLHFIRYVAAQMLIQPPESTTAALGTNATFSCRGIGRVLWQINGTQVQDASQVPVFANAQVFVPLPRDNFSELIVTATRETNATLMIMCHVDPFEGVGDPDRSDLVRLLVYAEPNPPVDLNLSVDGLSLVAKWNKPFSLEGEVLSYVIFITNNASGEQDKFNTNTTTYVLSEPIEERDCAEYMITVFSNNSYSMSMTNISGYGSIPTVPVVIRRSDVWINVSLIEDIQIIISFNPADPCPAYPVISYTLNISEESGNFTTTLEHTGSTSESVNINGSGLDLLRDQVYHLIIEATNTIGSTSSEKIQLYTTGLQSSFAVVEVNGSITVTCTFATGASSTGCQVTILMDGLQVFSTIITHPNRINQVSMNVMIENYSTLLVHTVEVLSGGIISHNVMFNQIVIYTVMATSTTIPFTTTSAAKAQVPLEYIIIVAILCAVLVLMLIITIVVSAIFFGARRKGGRQDLSNQDRHVLTTPAYESIEIDDETFLQNPIYNDDVIVPPTSETAAATPRLCQVPETLQIQTHNGDPALDLRTSTSYDSTSSPTTHVPYRQTSASKIDTKAGESDQLKESRGESNANIHTDPVTGYSTLSRPEKSYPTFNRVPFYESVKVKDFCLQSDDKVTAHAINYQYSTLKQDSHPPLITSHASGCKKANPQEVSVQYQALPTMKHAIPTDPETGYSSMLRPDRVVPPSGPVPLYHVIRVQHKNPAVVEECSEKQSGSHTSSSISSGHNPTT